MFAYADDDDDDDDDDEDDDDEDDDAYHHNSAYKCRHSPFSFGIIHNSNLQHEPM